MLNEILEYNTKWDNDPKILDLRKRLFPTFLQDEFWEVFKTTPISPSLEIAFMVDDTGHYIADNGAVLAPKFGLDADTINHVLASQDYLKRLYNAREKMEQQNQRLFHEQEPARRQRKAEEDAKKPPSYLKQFLYGEYDEIPTNIFVKGMLEDVSAVATDYDYRHISFAEYKAQIKSIVQQVKDQNALQEFRSQMEDSFVNNVGWTKTDMSVLRNAVRKAGGITQH